jgi:hypothetical protein
MYSKRRVERHFSSKMKRKSRDLDLTLELSCHAGCPTVYDNINNPNIYLLWLMQNICEMNERCNVSHLSFHDFQNNF